MQLADILRTMTPSQRERLAAACKTTVPYLRKMAGGHCLPSVEMFTRLQKRQPSLTLDGFIQARKGRQALHRKKAARRS